MGQANFALTRDSRKRGLVQNNIYRVSPKSSQIDIICWNSNYGESTSGGNLPLHKQQSQWPHLWEMYQLEINQNFPISVAVTCKKVCL